MKLVKDTNQEEEIKKVSDKEAEDAFRTILAWMGENPAREGLLETPVKPQSPPVSNPSKKSKSAIAFSLYTTIYTTIRLFNWVLFCHSAFGNRLVFLSDLIDLYVCNTGLTVLFVKIASRMCL